MIRGQELLSLTEHIGAPVIHDPLLLAEVHRKLLEEKKNMKSKKADALKNAGLIADQDKKNGKSAGLPETHQQTIGDLLVIDTDEAEPSFEMVEHLQLTMAETVQTRKGWQDPDTADALAKSRGETVQQLIDRLGKYERLVLQVAQEFGCLPSYADPEKGNQHIIEQIQSFKRDQQMLHAIDPVFSQEHWKEFGRLKEEVEVLRKNVPVSSDPQIYQERVWSWMLECFGEEISSDRDERCYRFLEEALELVQASGCTADDAYKILKYVYGRPTGDQFQEVGGVMVTLAALCCTFDLDLEKAAETELARVWQHIEQIRIKQQGKPQRSPLPQAPHVVRILTGQPQTSSEICQTCQGTGARHGGLNNCISCDGTGRIDVETLVQPVAEKDGKWLTWLEEAQHIQLEMFEQFIHADIEPSTGKWFAFFKGSGSDEDYNTDDLPEGAVSGCESKREALQQLAQRAESTFREKGWTD